LTSAAGPTARAACRPSSLTSIYQVLVRFAGALSADVTGCNVADRGFADHKPCRVLTEQLNSDQVIRFHSNVTVIALDGETRKVLRGAQVTADRYPVGTVLCMRDKDVKQACCPAVSHSASSPVAYGEGPCPVVTTSISLLNHKKFIVRRNIIR
jgi:hypothetical protein